MNVVKARLSILPTSPQALFPRCNHLLSLLPLDCLPIGLTAMVMGGRRGAIRRKGQGSPYNSLQGGHREGKQETTPGF